MGDLVQTMEVVAGELKVEDTKPEIVKPEAVKVEKAEEAAEASAKRKRDLVESKEQHWRTSRMVEDYVTLTSDLMVPKVKFGRYGFAAEFGEYPIERPTLLGVLMSPCRRPNALENWCPREVAVFEGAIALYGKDFRTIQRFVQTKSTKEIIDFYYLWKMSSHYVEWKRNFVPEFPSPYDPEEPPTRR